jgi:hypothetical protein
MSMMLVLEVVRKEVELPPFRPRKMSKRDSFRRLVAGASSRGLVGKSMMRIASSTEWWRW